MQILKTGPFKMERKKRQRKSGGAKNVFTIYVNLGYIGPAELDSINNLLDQYDTEPIVSRHYRTFKKRAEAEKAWIQLVLRWS